MKGIVYFYSSTGNTKLAVNYISRHLSGVSVDLCDIANESIVSPEAYDFVGFASFAEYLGPPTLMNRFMKTLEKQEGKPAFVLNTYAGFTGPTQAEFAKQAGARGFNVFAGHSFVMPMNYPPMRRNGKLSDDAPSEEGLKGLDDFIASIDKGIEAHKNGEKLKPLLSPMSIKRLAPSLSRDKVKKDFGIQVIDEDLCVNCGNCAKVCAYKAIEMTPFPVVDHDKCNGCWACYNTCPKKAIKTEKFAGEHQYKGPSKELIAKMSK